MNINFHKNQGGFQKQGQQKLCREWDLNPRQLRLVPKTSALDHSAITTDEIKQIRIK
jgi:hypothetical protein